MRKLFSYSIYLLSFVLLEACRPDINPKSQDLAKKPDTSDVIVDVPVASNCEPSVSNFFAGQHTLAGTITITNDSANLYVTFQTTDGWKMSETHVYAGSFANLPKTPTGNPKIGNFPFKAVHSPAVESYTYTISRNSFGADTCIVVAAHAVVVKYGENGSIVDQQTAWGAGTQFNASGSWATYINYCLCNKTDGDGGSGDGGSGDGGSGDGGNGDGGNGDGGNDGGGNGGGGIIEGAAPANGGN